MIPTEKKRRPTFNIGILKVMAYVDVALRVITILRQFRGILMKQDVVIKALVMG